MKVSLVQTNPQPDRARNLDETRALMEEAYRAEGPDLIVLPEYFEAYGLSVAEKLAMAEPVGGAAYRMASDFAREHRVFVHAGTIMEKVENEARIWNTSFVFDRSGREVAAYRKIHMFDIVAPDGSVYRESDSVKPGGEIVTYDIDGLKVGCAICYDIRFAELFLRLAKAGCDLIVLPAAFTLQTGKDHWEVLAKARAIETQAYFIACGQTGAVTVDGERRACYGHSLVCDPWGHTIARVSDGVGLVSTRIDRGQIARVRGLIPMAQHRRLACG
ncbi:carbon-nitrogen hydrolase family protein [Achromobacter sp. Marseille-Q0513]|uniref:carbon-nitrogen hydrolase family protein n=1 Tax=Achromobacter sp. Marseille-Q0513 TaxID=2829161 RepID=UPI001B9DAAF5|nr:carbon-nitrogen hydrolase family protein [Achromobacter sp. Marseille-Q0513]MBR8652031.1 carbon-nitrogen hydrolase family protein [Achromobacter sp. Marseille-Q0513]